MQMSVRDAGAVTGTRCGDPEERERSQAQVYIYSTRAGIRGNSASATSIHSSCRLCKFERLGITHVPSVRANGRSVVPLNPLCARQNFKQSTVALFEQKYNNHGVELGNERLCTVECSRGKVLECIGSLTVLPGMSQ